VLANLVIAIEKRNGLLTNKSNSAQGKLNSQGLFVNRFQKSWTKFAIGTAIAAAIIASVISESLNSLPAFLLPQP